jgi:hypothetical protein
VIPEESVEPEVADIPEEYTEGEAAGEIPQPPPDLEAVVVKPTEGEARADPPEVNSEEAEVLPSSISL